MCLNRLNLTKSFVVLCFISLLSICVFSQNYQAVGMKLDSAGNIFVVGKRYTTADDSDVLLVKYSASGIQLWAEFYIGPDGKNDEPTDIDIDDSGNIYICGRTLNTASNYDYLTLKYSNEKGQLLWAKTYNGPAAYIDEAKAIVVNQYGSVYVTGTCTNLTVGSDDDDIMTIKYDTNGNLLWTKSYSGSPDDKDVGVDIGLDSNGNAYVTGYSLTASNYEDYVLIKYTPTGTESWVKTYNGTGGDYDLPTKLFVDEDDNIYVTGYSYGGVSGEDWATLKYDVNGNLQWEKRYIGTTDGNDRPSSIAVDSAGGVYVVGYSDNFPNFNDMTTVKYNSAGTQLWINKFNGPINYHDEAVDVAVYNNNVFVFGKSYSSTAELYDYVLIKYELDGTKDWLARYNKGDESPAAIAIDSVGNIYVTGSTQDASGVSDFLTIRYNQNGHEIWISGFVAQVPGVELIVESKEGLQGEEVAIPVSTNNMVEAIDWGFDLQFDSNKLDVVSVLPGSATTNWSISGNEVSSGVLRITGNAGSTGTPVSGQNQQILIITFQIKANAIAGEVDLIGVNGSGTGALTDATFKNGTLTIGISGNPVLTIGSGSGKKGEEVTISVTVNNVASFSNWEFDLGFDNSGLSFVKVEKGASIEDWSSVTGSLTGEVLNVKGVRGGGTTLTGSGYEIAKITFKIGENAAGVLFLTPSKIPGATTTTNSLADATLISGQITVELTMGYEEAIRVGVDSEGNVYATGVTFNEQNLSGILTVKYDNDGNELWTKIFDVNTTYPPTYQQFRPAALSVFTDGSVYIAAQAWVGEPGHDYVSDYFTLKYDTDGNLLWFEVFNGFDFYYDDPVDMDLDDQGNVYITGKSWGPGELSDIVTIKYSANGGIPDPNGDPYRNPVWCKVYTGQKFGILVPIDEPYDMVVKNNAVYITGKTYYKNLNEDPKADDFDAVILKYNKDTGEELIADRIPMFWYGDDGKPKRDDDIGKNIDVGTVPGQGDFIFVTIHSYNPVTSDWEIVTVKYPDYISAEQGSENENYTIEQNDQKGLTIGTGSGKSYDEVQIPVYVENVSGFRNWEFELEFNNTLLTYTGVLSGTNAPGDWTISGNSFGNILVVSCVGSTPINDDITTPNPEIAKIKFKLGYVQNYIQTPLTIKAVYNDLSGAIMYNGIVRISPLQIPYFYTYYDGSGLSDDEPFDMVLVPGENALYITGKRRGTAYDTHPDTFFDYVTLKYDITNIMNADPVWVAGYNAPLDDQAIAVGYANQANVKVIVTGHSYLTTNDTEYMTIGYDYDAAYNANREEWRANYGSGKNLNQPADMVLDEDGNVYIAGKRYTPGSSGYDFVVLKYNNNGELLWERIYGSSGTDNWTFNTVLGDSTGSNLAGVLTITYNNTSVYSFWQRPIATNVVRLEPDTLYKADVTVLSSATGSTVGSYPDFRLYAGTYSGTGNLYFVSSFLSNGGANYISPKSTGTEYSYYFEPTGLTPNPPYSPYPVSDANLVFQFEGFNFPFGGRPNLVGTSIGLNRFVLEKYSGFDVNEAGASVHTITSSIGFAIGSGTANGWTFSSPSIAGNARATGSRTADNQGLVIKANPMGTNNFAYGAFDANPFIGTNLPSFGGGTLYRATFNLTTDVTAGGGVNIPMPQVRIQTGDSHLILMASTNSLSAFNKIIGPAENPDNYIDLWFYYPNTRTGTNKENKLFPSFEFFAIKGMGIPDGASITLRDFWLTAHTAPTP